MLLRLQYVKKWATPVGLSGHSLEPYSIKNDKAQRLLSALVDATNRRQPTRPHFGASLLWAPTRSGHRKRFEKTVDGAYLNKAQKATVEHLLSFISSSLERRKCATVVLRGTVIEGVIPSPAQHPHVSVC